MWKVVREEEAVTTTTATVDVAEGGNDSEEEKKKRVDEKKKKKKNCEKLYMTVGKTYTVGRKGIFTRTHTCIHTYKKQRIHFLI